MMAASKSLPFPMGIICLLFFRGYSSLPTTSAVTGTYPRPRGSLTETEILSTEDYDRLEDTVTPTLPRKVTVKEIVRCKYDPCLDGQVLCKVLADSTGCLCPGFTLYDVVPETPSLKSVSWNGSQVVIQWCAPNSYVTAYVVTVGGKERQKVGKDRRSGAVDDIDHIAEVCVVAENDRGASNGSCMMYHPRDASLPLKAGLIGGALGFLLLLLLAVLLWRRQRQRKQEASISMRDTAGTQ